jgi:DNA-binding NtrC family response regulator
LIHKGLFREDLYYRIDVLPVRLPCLSDRADEIIHWARHMLKRRHESSASQEDAVLSDKAAERLVAHRWPGNLRQLENIVRRAYALALRDQSGSAGALTIEVAHVERALTNEARPARGSTLELMERAAEGFVIEAERWAARGEKLNLDHTDALKGLALEHAKRRSGGDESEALRRAFILLGKESVVKDRNHAASFRRECEKVDLLRRALDPDESRK